MSLRPKEPGLCLNKENQKGGKPVAVAMKATAPTAIPHRPAFKEVGNKLAPEKIVGAQTKKLNDPVINAKKTGVVSIKTTEWTKQKVTYSKKIAEVKPCQDKLLIKQVSNLKTEPDSYSTKQLASMLNVDSSDDPLLVSVYAQDIYNYLLELETTYGIDKHFLLSSRSTSKMRSILVNWMVEVHTNFKLLLETLHLSIAIVDRYLSVNRSIGRETLQLVGATAMWLATKYEEIFVPDISDFVYICDDTYTKQQFLGMEMDILKKLNFNLGRPLSLHFLRRYSKLAQVKADHHTLSKYFLELILLEYDMCHIKPSLQAAAACCLSISILDDLANPEQAWSPILMHYSSYSYAAIKPTIAHLARTLIEEKTSKYQSIHNKYASASYNKISINPKLQCNLVKKLTIKKK